MVNIKILGAALFSLIAVSAVTAAETLAQTLGKELPQVEKQATELHKRLVSGFQFKGYDKSPGHQAILAEMEHYHTLLQTIQRPLQQSVEFPQQAFEALEASRQKVAELLSYVVMDPEVTEVVDQWQRVGGDFASLKRAKEKEIQIAQMKRQTELLEQEIERQQQKLQQDADAEIAAREARLQALKDHYQLMRSQNTTIIQAGYTTPAGYFPCFGNGYYYNNGTFYPRYGNGYINRYRACPTPRRPLLRINVR